MVLWVGHFLRMKKSQNKIPALKNFRFQFCPDAEQEKTEISNIFIQENFFPPGSIYNCNKQLENNFSKQLKTIYISN